MKFKDVQDFVGTRHSQFTGLRVKDHTMNTQWTDYIYCMNDLLFCFRSTIQNGYPTIWTTLLKFRCRTPANLHTWSLIDTWLPTNTAVQLRLVSMTNQDSRFPVLLHILIVSFGYNSLHHISSTLVGWLHNRRQNYIKECKCHLWHKQALNMLKPYCFYTVEVKIPTTQARECEKGMKGWS